MTKAEMFGELRAMLNDLLQAKTKGASYPRLARAHGYVDGYMKALLETGMATKKELLALVADERTALHGPALVERPASSDAGVAA